MRAARLGAALAAAVLLAGPVGPAAPAGAATPGSSTLKAPKQPGVRVSAWTGSFAYPALEANVLLAYDAHELTIKVPGNAARFFTTRDAVLRIDLTWDGGSSNDMDLYVLDSESGTVASSAQTGSDRESVTIPVTGSVTYTVEARNWLSAPDTAYEVQAFLVVS